MDNNIIDKLELGVFHTSGGSASQYIKSELGQQSLSVNTWNEKEDIEKGLKLANNIIRAVNNYDSLLRALKLAANEYKNDSFSSDIHMVIGEAIQKAEQ